MRFLAIVKSSPEAEAGEMGPPEMFEEMGNFNEELVKNGVMLGGEGLKPSKDGVRIQYSGRDGRKVVDGPFAESKELVAGFWLIQARDLADAVEWMKRAPFQDGEVEIRPIFETEEFGEELPEHVREQEIRLRDQLAQK